MQDLQITDAFEPYYEGRQSGFFRVKPESVKSAMDAVDRFRLRHGSVRRAQGVESSVSKAARIAARPER